MSWTLACNKVLLTREVAKNGAAEWRLPFGQAGILDFFLELIATEEMDLAMEAQILRLIGNACADTGSSPLAFPFFSV